MLATAFRENYTAQFSHHTKDNYIRPRQDTRPIHAMVFSIVTFCVTPLTHIL